jgi:4-aminobutyrate aminotransferase-like enzyme/Ser/Thr protein kinase RdoA (MazF antagonist)
MFSAAPRFSPDDLRVWLAEQYGVDAVSFQPQGSERDAVVLVTDDQETRYILKVANPDESEDFLHAQNGMLARLAQVWPEGSRVLANRRGQLLSHLIDFSGRTCLARLLTFVPGHLLAEFPYRSPQLLESLGDYLGQMNATLSGDAAPGLERWLPWDLQHGRQVVADLSQHVLDPSLRSQLEQILRHYDRYVAPWVVDLPRSAIHNDANPYNWLVDVSPAIVADRVIALLDFGDAVWSWTVGELAIALAYLTLDAEDVWAATVPVIRRYHQRRPLGEAELEVLFGLILLRLATSVVMAAEGLSRDPRNAYLQISQQPLLRTLPKLLEIPARLATAVFRDACQLPPVAEVAEFSAWLRAQRGRWAMPLPKLEQANGLRLDLSCQSPLLADLPWPLTEPDLTRRIDATLAEHQADYGIGHYFEPRVLYQSPQFGSAATLPTLRRTIHLGMDLFAPAGTPVCAVADGVVHAVGRLDQPLDYGTLVVLRHAWREGDCFYTLYGHLATFAAGDPSISPADNDPDARSRIVAPQVGSHVAAGSVIGLLGPPSENGGWPPHLHFQILRDDLDDPLHFPGVGHAELSRVWAALSPNPQTPLDLPACRVAACEDPHLDLQAEYHRLAESRGQRIGGSVRLSYHHPLHLVLGRGVHVFDAWGRGYLDAYNNVPHLGHGHPEVVAAAALQMRLINTNTRYLHAHAMQFAGRLAETLPDPLKVCFFLSSATEANELALRLARAAVARNRPHVAETPWAEDSADVWVMDTAYHGHSSTLIDCSPYKHDGPGGRGRPAWVQVVELPDVYRGRYRDPQTAGGLYAADVVDRMNAQRAAGRQIIWLAETCPSVAGQILLPAGYLSSIYDAVRAAQGICIADEVQTGYGRLGTAFFGFQMHDVVPDIVVLGKSIGNGFPLAAVVTTAEIAGAFDNGMEFFSTFGGSTVSCAVGDRVLEITRRDGLPQQAAEVGRWLESQFQRLQQSFTWIGDVRGSGLFWGLDIVCDASTREPNPALAGFLKQRLCDRGILIGTDGRQNNVLKIRPPLPFAHEHAERLIQTLETVCHEVPTTAGWAVNSSVHFPLD